MKKINGTLITLLMLATNLYAQGNEPIEMADVLRQSGKIYTVVFGLLVILTGMIIFLIRVDRKVTKIEKGIEGEINGM